MTLFSLFVKFTFKFSAKRAPPAPAKYDPKSVYGPSVAKSAVRKSKEKDNRSDTHEGMMIQIVVVIKRTDGLILCI